MNLGVTLYLQNSVEAVAFYCEAFNMTVGYHEMNKDGTYLHAELEKDGKSVFAISESTDAEFKEAMLSAHQPTMSLGVNFADDEELNRAYEVLKMDAHVIRPLGPLPWCPASADVVDKYGVCWYIYVTQYKVDER
jgi:PhnB protein